MSDRQPDERTLRAADALTNPVLREAFTLLRDGYLAALRRCAAKDDLGRYRYAVALNAVDAVERHLRSTVETGALSETESGELADPPRRWIPKF